jgi:DNA-binding NarL/FixJ family response regulator
MISVTEIVLIIVGILAVILGYLIPNGSALSDMDEEMTEAKINDMVRKAIRNSQGQIDEMLDECTEEAINKAERAMDRVTNEKMSAISEYSDTVMNDIHKNHDEVMFMYDMLNDKHKNLKNTVSEVNRAAKEVKQTAKEAVLTAEQAEEKARQAKEAAMQADISSEAITYNEKKEDEKQFSSLVDILDRADSAAAQKTANRVIGTDTAFAGNVITPEVNPVSEEKPKINEVEEIKYEERTSESEKAFESEKTFESEKADAVPVNNETAPVKDRTESYDMPPVEELPVVKEEGNVSAAKVVSISDASRKKAAEAMETQPQTVSNDPASRNQRILDMHKAGKSAVVIARELKLGIGEVKLVIDLAGKHKKNRSSIM